MATPTTTATPTTPARSTLSERVRTFLAADRFGSRVSVRIAIDAVHDYLD